MDQLNTSPELSYNEDGSQVLFAWKAPSWIFKKRSKDFFSTIGAIVFLLSIILFFAGEFMLIFVVLSVAFVAYAFSTNKPEAVEHEINTHGIVSGGKLFPWYQLGRYWFSERNKQEVLFVETGLTFPRHLIMLLGSQDKKKLQKILSDYLVYEKPQNGFFDNGAAWLAKKLPLDG